MSDRTLSSGFSLRRSNLRNAAMNIVLVMLLAGVFLWSVAGNAIDTFRASIERHI